jgi:hypothetical protein
LGFALGRALRVELEGVKAAGEGGEHGLGLDAGEGGAEAVVDAVAEGEVLVGGAADVEAVGVGDERGVAVGGGEVEEQALADLESLAAELEGLVDPPRNDLHGGVVAEHLLDGGGDEGGVVAQGGPLLGVAGEGPRAVADQVAGGLVAGEQQHGGEHQQLGLAEVLAVVLGGTQGGQQVVLRLGAARGDQRGDVGGELVEAPGDRGELAGRGSRARGTRRSSRRRGGPGPGPRRHAEHLHDDRRGQRDRQRGHQLDRAGLGGAVEGLAHELLDARAQPLDRARA